MTTPKTLIEAVRYYSDIERCNEVMRQIKWPDGTITCPECGSDRIGEIRTRHMLRCKECRKQFSYRVGTIFEDSPLGLDKWFVAVWCVANAKNGISSCELGRALGVTQKTAWFMLHRIRLAMQTKTFQKYRGTCESDETYIGGKAGNMHEHKREKRIQGRGTVDKTIVHGILERGDDRQISRVSASVVARDDGVTLLHQIRQLVKRGAKVFTDAATAYNQLCFTHKHKSVDHGKTYVVGEVHTNGIENFWSLLGRSLKGTYVAVAPFHLFRYVNEQAFRFNFRDLTDQGRFAQLMLQTVGKRITYRNLCGIGDAGFMGIE